MALFWAKGYKIGQKSTTASFCALKVVFLSVSRRLEMAWHFKVYKYINNGDLSAQSPRQPKWVKSSIDL